VGLAAAKRVPLALALACAVSLFGLQQGRIAMISHGLLPQAYILIALPLYLGAAAINCTSVLSVVPQGSRCGHILPALAISVVLPVLHWLRGRLFTFYFGNHAWMTRALLCSGMLAVARDVALFCCLSVVARFYLLSSHGHAVFAAAVNTFFIATVQVLQVSSREPVGVAAVYFALMLVEVLQCRSLLQGQTTMQKLGTTLARVVRGSPRPVAQPVQELRMDSVVADGSAGAEPGTPHAARGAWGEPAASPQAANAQYDVGAMCAMVVTSNVMELCTMMWITVCLLIVPVNPFEVAGPPLQWQTTLVNGALGIAFELLSDFLTACHAYKDPSVAVDILEACQEHVQQREHSRLYSALVFVMQLSWASEGLSQFLIHLCPTPEASLAQLRALSKCPMQ